MGVRSALIVQNDAKKKQRQSTLFSCFAAVVCVYTMQLYEFSMRFLLLILAKNADSLYKVCLCVCVCLYSEPICKLMFAMQREHIHPKKKNNVIRSNLAD